VLTARSVPARALAGTPVTLTATATDGQSPVTLRWRFPDGRTATGAQVTHTFTAAGPAVVELVAEDGGGNTAVERHAVEVAATPLGEAGPLPKPGDDVVRVYPPACGGGHLTVPRGFRCVPPRDGAAPRVTAAKLRPTAFKAQPRGGSLGRGAKLTLRLSERATLAFRVERPGRGGRWTALPGTFSAKAEGGAVTLRFSGRLAGRKLAPGRHRLVLVARDAAGNAAAPVRVAFRVVR
jgi:hypothetical protein